MRVANLLALPTGLRGRGIESRLRQNSAHNCTALQSIEHIITTSPISGYDLNDAVRGVKHQIIIFKLAFQFFLFFFFFFFFLAFSNMFTV